MKLSSDFLHMFANCFTGKCKKKFRKNSLYLEGKFKKIGKNVCGKPY